MKLRVFQSDKGDCLLITSSDGKNVLVDGGMASSYNEHVAQRSENYRMRVKSSMWSTCRISTKTISPAFSK